MQFTLFQMKCTDNFRVLFYFRVDFVTFSFCFYPSACACVCPLYIVLLQMVAVRFGFFISNILKDCL